MVWIKLKVEEMFLGEILNQYIENSIQNYVNQQVYILVNTGYIIKYLDEWKLTRSLFEWVKDD